MSAIRFGSPITNKLSGPPWRGKIPLGNGPINCASQLAPKALFLQCHSMGLARFPLAFVFLSRFFSPNRGENKKRLKPPPRYVYTWTFKSGCQMVPLQGGNKPQSVRVDNWHPFEDAGMSVCV